MLAIDDLTVRYRTAAGEIEALSSVSLTVAKGSTLALVGESGSGKSTVALAAMGLLPPEARLPAGRILFDGQDILTMNAEERRRLRGSRIGLVFQDPFSVLNPSLRIGDQVGEGLIHHRGFTQERAFARAIELLDEVGIINPEAVAKAYPHELSGGMRQRALIAGALASEPELLILDEPTTALDVTIEAQILDLLESLRVRRGLTMLFISHNLGVVRRIADEVAVLYAGQIVEQGATEDVLQRPVHPYAKGLLAAIPRLGQKKGRLASIPGRLPDLRNPPTGCRFARRCPFATPDSEAPQVLRDIGARKVRCTQAEALRDIAWPVLGEDAPSSPVVRAADAAPAVTEPVVAVEGLTKRFVLSNGPLRFEGWRPMRTPVIISPVDDISLEVAAGEVLGLVGESGSGKTTLGRTILRLTEANSGTIRIAGETVSDKPQRALESMRRTAQIVFQNPDSSLNPRKTIRELLGRPIQRFGLAAPGDIPARVNALLDLVRLPAHYADRYAHQMSGGEKQRVGIARALATEPRFIVCDEPVSALDVSVQAAIVNLLADLRDRLGVAYLFISHDISIVAHLADRIAVMHRGKMVEIGSAEEVMRAPRHPYTIKLLSAVPRVDGPIHGRGPTAVSSEILSA
ncbi:ABC transporter ATP-binding protein [Bosea lathyri]|uniref:Peptide/nickel transport system ATP-binding protein n=1 Tax=Bosea lathyri TaxID=1036778 RepID=A0A1H5ZVA7_9HYPH|nr:ABC transporter ATP-binding protein [Bosea lathyri]SEG40428.1 peptide/nickel transport system ATP-binding protein [Bosea lathyri]